MENLDGNILIALVTSIVALLGTRRLLVSK